MVKVLPALRHPAGERSQLERSRLEGVSAQFLLHNAAYTRPYHPSQLSAQRWEGLGGLPSMLFPPGTAGS